MNLLTGGDVATRCVVPLFPSGVSVARAGCSPQLRERRLPSPGVAASDLDVRISLGPLRVDRPGTSGDGLSS